MTIAAPFVLPSRAVGGSMERAPFGALPDGRAVERFTLRNTRGMEVAFTGWGGAILSIRVPDRDGVSMTWCSATARSRSTWMTRCGWAR
jgi:galactose mutarotase-like enzyme